MPLQAIAAFVHMQYLGHAVHRGNRPRFGGGFVAIFAFATTLNVAVNCRIMFGCANFEPPFEVRIALRKLLDDFIGVFPLALARHQ